jgi:hypothetical protein
MYDGKYVIPGLIVFVALMTFPIWKNMGNAGPVPKPEKPKGVTKCIDSTQFMRTSHMKVLDEWRNQVLRDGNRTPIEVEGVEYDRSLMNGCMKCHNEKKKFCDECHTYASVKPYCWDCHFVPKETF